MPRIETDELLRALTTLADEGGLDAITMTSVAAALGVRPPSLYGRYRDRTALLDRLALHALHRLTDAVADAVAGRAGRDALAALTDAHRSFARAEPGLWAALQRPVPPAVAAESDSARLVALMRGALSGYRLPEGELVHAIRFLGATVNGFLALERSGGFAHSTPSAAASWARAVDALDVLLRAWPAGPAHRPNGDPSSTP